MNRTETPDDGSQQADSKRAGSVSNLVEPVSESESFTAVFRLSRRSAFR
jgi:hypothetical protein